MKLHTNSFFLSLEIKHQTYCDIKNKILLILLFFISHNSLVYAQSDVEELLKKVNDSKGVERLMFSLKYADKIKSSSPSRSIIYCDSVIYYDGPLDIPESIIGDAYFIKAIAKKNASRYAEGITCIEKAIIYYSKTEHPDKLKESYFVKFDLHYLSGNLDESIKCARKLLNKRSPIGVRKEAFVYSRLGRIYRLKGDLKKSIDNYELSAIKYKNLGEHENEVQILQNLASVQNEYGNYNESLNTLNSAKKISKKNGFTASLEKIESATLTVESNIVNKNDTEFEKDNKEEIDRTILEYKEKTTKSLEEIEKLSKEKQLVELKKRVQADEFNERILKEKIKNQEIESRLSKERLHSEKLALELQNKKLESQRKTAENQMLFSILVGVIVITLLISLLLYYNILNKRRIKKKNVEILEQKDTIERKQSKIDESINYAERIQNSFVPPVLSVSDYFQNSHILNLPKDQVSGDFVWSYENSNHIIICCCDCTGHGVPGAFMTLVFNNILNDIVVQKCIFEPSKILENSILALSDRLQSMKNETEFNEFKDGMDASIISINKKSKEAIYSGAKNNLVLVQVGSEAPIIYKGSRKSIDVLSSEFKESFKSYLIQVQKGDKLYMSSDGFYDQKGGPNNKKMYRKRFVELLYNTSQDKLSKQFETLEREFITWKNENDQVDDVLVLGIEV